MDLSKQSICVLHESVGSHTVNVPITLQNLDSHVSTTRQVNAVLTFCFFVPKKGWYQTSNLSLLTALWRHHALMFRLQRQCGFTSNRSRPRHICRDSDSGHNSQLHHRHRQHSLLRIVPRENSRIGTESTVRPPVRAAHDSLRRETLTA
jgi:hypothetical protein